MPTPPRLPVPGQDEGVWGNILNEYLLVEHAENGSLRRAAEFAAKYDKPAGGIPLADLADSLQTSVAEIANKYVKPGGGIPSTDLASVSPAKIEPGTGNDGKVLKVVGGTPQWSVESAPGESLTVPSSTSILKGDGTGGIATATPGTDYLRDSDPINPTNLSAAVPVSKGGTNATTVLGAQQSLDLEVGVDVQAYSDNLASFAGKAAPSGTVVGTSDTQELTNKTLTSPKIGTAITDTNGNEIIVTPATASAVNEVTVANAATGTAPRISASGGDTDVDLLLSGKGTGKVRLGSAGVSFPNSDGTPDQILKTDGSGNLSFITAAGITGTGLMSSVINVVDYGATPNDDTQDDWQAIKDAVTALEAAGGGILYFPRGSYVVKKHIGNGGATGDFEINGLSGFSIIGYGAKITYEGTGIVRNGTVEPMDAFRLRDCSRFSIEGLELDGDVGNITSTGSMGTAQPTWTTTTGYYITPSGDRTFTAREDGPVQGGETEWTSGGVVTYPMYIMKPGGGGSRYKVMAPRAEGRGFGILTSGCRDYTIKDMHIHHFAADGIYLGGAYGNAADRNATLINCRVSACARQGLSVIALKAGTFISCVFENTGLTNAAGTDVGNYGWHLPASGVDVEPNRVAYTAYRKWTANTAYGVGDQIVPNSDNGHVYVCTVAGTSGAGPGDPAFSTTGGGTTADNTVTWLEVGETGVDVNTGDLLFKGCTFQNNLGYATYSAQAQFCTSYRTSGVVVDGCWLYSGTKQDTVNSSVINIGGPNVIVRNSFIRGNHVQLATAYVSNVLLSGNSIESNGYGIKSTGGGIGKFTVENNLITGTHTSASTVPLVGLSHTGVIFRNNRIFLPSAMMAAADKVVSQVQYAQESSGNVWETNYTGTYKMTVDYRNAKMVKDEKYAGKVYPYEGAATANNYAFLTPGSMYAAEKVFSVKFTTATANKAFDFNLPATAFWGALTIEVVSSYGSVENTSGLLRKTIAGGWSGANSYSPKSQVEATMGNIASRFHISDMVYDTDHWKFTLTHLNAQTTVCTVRVRAVAVNDAVSLKTFEGITQGSERDGSSPSAENWGINSGAVQATSAGHVIAASTAGKVATYTTDTTIGDVEVALLDCAGGNRTFILPAANSLGASAARRLVIMRTDASANTCTVQRAGSDTVSGSGAWGATSVSLSAQGSSKTLVSNGSGAWYVAASS